VEKVLQHLKPTVVPRPLVVKIVREELALVRRQTGVPTEETILAQIADRIADEERTRIQPVINATGVVIHTNLGRAPLGVDVIAEMAATGSHYNNLEYDLATGKRGSRGDYVERCLATLCNSEAATRRSPSCSPRSRPAAAPPT
jgi:L-seryl-tRNA(Ser) seleniumtransferase